MKKTRVPDRCPFCDRLFASRQGRGRHERHAHPGMVTPEMRKARIDQSNRESAQRGHVFIRWPDREQQAEIDAWNRLVKAASAAADSSAERAVRWGSVGVLTTWDLVALAGPCHYCGAYSGPGWDHVVPLSRGGANAPENIVPCCLACNMSKGARTPEQWRSSAA